MKMKPPRGIIFVKPIDHIPSSKVEMGFGGTTDKQKPETPYKFLVVEVGQPEPHHGLWVSSEVLPGDIISHNSTNSTLREQRETAGFIIDGEWYLPVMFQDVMGIWRQDEEDSTDSPFIRSFKSRSSSADGPRPSGGVV